MNRRRNVDTSVITACRRLRTSVHMSCNSAVTAELSRCVRELACLTGAEQQLNPTAAEIVLTYAKTKHCYKYIFVTDLTHAKRAPERDLTLHCHCPEHRIKATESMHFTRICIAVIRMHMPNWHSKCKNCFQHLSSAAKHPSSADKAHFVIDPAYFHLSINTF
jgi:hypothetical protein